MTATPGEPAPWEGALADGGQGECGPDSHVFHVTEKGQGSRFLRELFHCVYVGKQLR